MTTESIVFKVWSFCHTLPEQQEIVRLHDEQFERGEQNEREFILKNAFTGQLVPQDPNDEPASVLLERIRSERDVLPITKPKKKVARKRMPH